jgi:hypothetical protein
MEHDLFSSLTNVQVKCMSKNMFSSLTKTFSFIGISIAAMLKSNPSVQFKSMETIELGKLRRVWTGFDLLLSGFANQYKSRLTA